jgi:hypothetical protein
MKKPNIITSDDIRPTRAIGTEGAGIAGREGTGIIIAQEGIGVADGIGGAISQEGIGGA